MSVRAVVFLLLIALLGCGQSSRRSSSSGENVVRGDTLLLMTASTVVDGNTNAIAKNMTVKITVTDALGVASVTTAKLVVKGKDIKGKSKILHEADVRLNGEEHIFMLDASLLAYSDQVLLDLQVFEAGIFIELFDPPYIRTRGAGIYLFNIHIRGRT